MIGRHVLVVGVALALGTSGCGDSEGTSETSRPDASNTIDAVKQEPANPSATQIREAEEVVRDELPSIPLWEKAIFRGVGTQSGDVCVDRIYSKDSAELLGGNRSAGYVTVAIPELTTSAPRDGKCARPLPDPGERLSLGELDELAEELIAVIETGDAAETASTARRIKTTLDKPVPMTTYQANLIHSATVAAIEGTQTDASSQMDAALRFLQEALDSSE